MSPRGTINDLIIHKWMLVIAVYCIKLITGTILNAIKSFHD